MKKEIEYEIGNTISKLLFIVALIILSFDSISQNNQKIKYKLTPGLGAFVSGDGHGAMYEGAFFLSNGKNIFSLGAIIQKRGTKFCGTSVSYIKPIFSNNYKRYGEPYQEFSEKNMQLCFLSKASYLHQTKLSRNVQAIEKEVFYTSTDEMPDFSEVKISTIEAFAGFGVNVKLGTNLILGNYIGAGAYYHLDYIYGMYHDKIAPVIVFGTSLRWFNNKN